jgi:hypothetical protein
MKKTYIGILFIFILSCASSGQIKGSRFIDNTYDFEVVFPDEYELTTHGERSIKRVHAMKWRTDMSLMRKPLFVISAIDTTAKFIDIVQKQKNVHFEPKYYLSCEIESEESETLRERDAYIVHYKGVAVKAATAFIEFKNYVLKIEYIVDADFFDEVEFMDILENISIVE